MVYQGVMLAPWTVSITKTGTNNLLDHLAFEGYLAVPHLLQRPTAPMALRIGPSGNRNGEYLEGGE